MRTVFSEHSNGHIRNLLRKGRTSPSTPEASLELASKQFSQETRALFKEFAHLDEKCDKICTVANMIAYPAHSALCEVQSASDVINKIKLLKTDSELEAIVLSNLSGRFAHIKNKLNEKTMKTFDYTFRLGMQGVSAADVEMAAQKYKEKDLQKAAETLLETTDGHLIEKPQSREQMQTVEEYYRRLLKVSFNLAPAKLKRRFSNFKDYLKTVEFTETENTSSCHITGKLYLSLRNPDIVYVWKGARSVGTIDVLGMADTVGEEGLLGHQGQHAFTENSNIPPFLKKSQVPALINAETIAQLGKYRLVEQLKKDPRIFPEIDREDFALLLRNSGIREESEKLGTFLTAYGDYTYFTKGRSIDAQTTALYEITKDPYLLTEISRNMRETHLKNFFGEHEKRASYWVYIVSDALARKIENKLGALSTASKERVLDQLQLGYWTRDSFEAYFDYLCKEKA